MRVDGEGGVTRGEGRSVGGDKGFIGPLGVNGYEQFGRGEDCGMDERNIPSGNFCLRVLNLAFLNNSRFGTTKFSFLLMYNF